jgi:hypothetical protein
LIDNGPMTVKLLQDRREQLIRVSQQTAGGLTHIKKEEI